MRDDYGKFFENENDIEKLLHYIFLKKEPLEKKENELVMNIYKNKELIRIYSEELERIKDKKSTNYINVLLPTLAYFLCNSIIFKLFEEKVPLISIFLVANNTILLGLYDKELSPQIEMGQSLYRIKKAKRKIKISEFFLKRVKELIEKYDYLQNLAKDYEEYLEIYSNSTIPNSDLLYKKQDNLNDEYWRILRENKKLHLSKPEEIIQGDYELSKNSSGMITYL